MTREQITKHIQQIFSLSELEYGQLVMDYAYRYLEVYLEGDTEGVRMLTLSSFFWEWWKNQWDYRNRAFVDKWRMVLIQRNLGEKAIEALRYDFLDFHNITPSDIRPSPQIMNMITQEWKKADQLYDEMISHVIKNEIRKP